MNIYTVYKISNTITNKHYIGFTKRTAQKRFKTHISEAKRNLYTMYLHNSIRHYGENNFIIEILENNLSYDEAASKESYYIKKLNTKQPHGYNEHIGGKGGCKELSNELRKKLSDAKKGYIPWNKGKKGVQKSWNKGKKGVQQYSIETRKKMSEKKKEYWERKRNESVIE